MKKIDIITFHNAYNYGAFLQAYALQKVLKEKENVVEFIDYEQKKITNNYKILKIDKNNILKSCLANFFFFSKRFRRNKKFRRAIKQNFLLSKKYHTEQELKQNPPKADVYITGSDQVWNIGITGGLKDAYTLNFGDPRIKRISYAASMGKCIEEEKEQYKQKLDRLNAIAVREEEAKQYLENIINKDIQVTLDPTLLIETKEWNSCLKQVKKDKEQYILAYNVQKSTEFYKIVNYLAKQTNLKIYYFDERNMYYKGDTKNVCTAGPFEFIELIKEAKYIVTTSFHATVFSILFQKKFFVIPHTKTGGRVTNLLKKLNVENRICENFEKFKDIDYDFETKYDLVNSILEKERKKSLDYLDKAIVTDIKE